MELSKDHKPDLPQEKSRILLSDHTVVDGKVDGRLSISRALGDWQFKNVKMEAHKMAVSAYPDVKTVQISKDHDFIICACDGIWDCMTSQEAVNFVKEALLKILEFKQDKF